MTSWKDATWAQFDAGILSLVASIEACPDDEWEGPCGNWKVWHMAYHTLFFLDLYLEDTLEGFEPPAPFTKSELEPGALPPRVWTRAELLDYAAHCRRKARERIASLTEATGGALSGIDWLARRDMTVTEALFYNLRHVQHHTAQINLALRQSADLGVPWIHRTDDPTAS